MNLKKVNRILPAHEIDMDGFPVKQALPTENVPHLDPFLLLHHGQVEPMTDRPARIQGVGPHPHRGFSPVTFVVEGEVHHRDSWGNSQIAKAGEVQWMHAGAGIIHSERPSDASVEQNMKQEIVQVWINSPSASKMKPPVYTHLAAPDFPQIPSEDGLSDLKLVTGNYQGVSGKLVAESELLVVWGMSKEGAKVSIHVPDGFNAAVYVIRGDMRIEGHGIVDPESLIVFEKEGQTIALEAKSDVQYILLGGKPIEEKMVQQGPFVMNTETQILEAMRDYRMGKMGFLVEEDLE